MLKKIAIATAAAALTAGLAAAPATAAPKNAGAACAQAGIAFLKSKGLFELAVKKQIDYSTVDEIRADLPVGSNLSLGQVVSLHTSSPEIFPWCD
jgi:hypothetical protein